MSKTDFFERDKAIIEYAPLVDKIARRLIARLPPNVEIDDLKSAGFIGLIDAIEKYTDEKGSPFKVYAEIRIRGAMIDELRAQDWVPRSVRDRNQQLKVAEQDLSEKLKRKPSESELAEYLEVSTEELRRMLSRSEIKSFLSIEDLNQQRSRQGNNRDLLESFFDPTQLTPEAAFEKADEEILVQKAIQTLKERQQVIVRLYYYEDMKLREIGEHLNITESRVSQILSESLSLLKSSILKLQRG